MILLKSNIYVSKDLIFADEVLFRKFGKTMLSSRKAELKKIKETRFGARSIYILSVTARLTRCYLDPMSTTDLTF